MHWAQRNGSQMIWSAAAHGYTLGILRGGGRGGYWYNWSVTAKGRKVDAGRAETLLAAKVTAEERAAAPLVRDWL